MSGQNISVMILIGVLCALFIIRIVKNRKIYDITILLILIMCILVRLPIGQAIPKPLIVTVSLGLALVAVLFYLKDKNDTLKKQIEKSKSQNTNDN